MERERDAQTLYADMMANCEEPALKAILEAFAEAERQHEEMLLVHYRALRQMGEFKD